MIFNFIKRRKFLVIFLVLVLIIVGVSIYNNNKPAEVLVRKGEITNSPIVKSVSASGILRADKQANLTLPGVALVDRVNVEVGSIVEQGEILGSIYNVTNTYTIQASKDARDIALRDRDLFIETYVNNKKALGGSEEYEIQLRKQNELVSRAEALYSAEISQLSNTIIRAPFKGTVLDLLYEKGELSTSATPFAIIADLSSYYFEITLDQEDFAAIKKDQKVNLSLDTYPDVEIKGEIKELPLYATDASEDFILKVKIPDTQLLLLPGMRGDAEIIIEEITDEVQAVSFDTIFFEGGKYYVWTADNEVLTKKEVEIGVEGDLYTEVITDLSDVELVIPLEDAEISEGSRIRYEE